MFYYCSIVAAGSHNLQLLIDHVTFKVESSLRFKLISNLALISIDNPDT